MVPPSPLDPATSKWSTFNPTLSFITVIKYPGRDAGTNPVNLYRSDVHPISYKQAVWMLHRKPVPLEETKQKRYYLVLTSL